MGFEVALEALGAQEGRARGFEVGDVALEEGDVFIDELFLQGDRVGGDDDDLAVDQAAKDSGDEVGVAFADACAGLDEEVGFGIHGLSDGAGHVELLGAGLEVIAQELGDGAGVGEDVVEGGHAGSIRR